MQPKEKTVASEIDARDKTSREINQQIRERINSGVNEIAVLNPEARHNLAVGIVTRASIVFQGSVGYYCGGLIDGPELEIQGTAGWGLGESMLSGTVQVRENAGNSCAASIRGGTIVVHGSVGARAGISMKGGLLIVGGDCGYMTGFMMQKGTVIVCGNAGPALGDSMYEGRVYVGGNIEELGNDAVVRSPDEADWNFLREYLTRWGFSADRPFKKIVAGRRLWNFDKQEIGLWREAL
jgi:glutamate synthase domain-containing protein 3